MVKMNLFLSILDDPLPSHIGDRSYVRFATSISHIDQTSERPKLYVEQQVFHHGQRKTIINELDFGGRVKRGEEYLFPECGDIDQNMIARDLRVRILSVSLAFTEQILLLQILTKSRLIRNL